ncbi:MAG: hypothetical protein ACRDHF_01265 [Tepidiformaceae bacterium]
MVLAGVGSILLGVPLAVLGPATGPYDDPKAWALAILATVTGVAWIARMRQEPPHRPAGADRYARALRWVVLAYLAWAVITTVTSVAPAQSVLGNFGRGVGVLTIGLAALLFFLTQSAFRAGGDVRSLVDAALLGSVPVCLLALAQVVGWDPLPKAWDPAVQSLTVRSTFGTHIFLGSYLVVLIPLTAARLEWALRARFESGGWPAPGRARWRDGLAAAIWVGGAVALVGLASRWSGLWWALVPWGVLGAIAWTLGTDRAERTADTALAAALLSGLLVCQVLIVLLSRGRGAFIGMLIGLGVASFAFLIRRRAWKILAVASLGVIGLVGFLVLLNRPGSPIASLGKVRLLNRLSTITNLERGTPGWVRVQLWRGISDGWSRQLHGEAVIPGVSPRLRSLIGYGPETQLLVLEPLATQFLGALPTSGEGWHARYVFDRTHNVLLDHVVTEGLVGACLWLVLVGSLIGIGIARLKASAGPGEAVVRVGALGAVLAHFADGQVGMATPMSLALFWLAAALLTSDAWTASSTARGRPRQGKSRKRRWGAALIIVLLLTALVTWASTRWLFASVAYADGVRSGITGHLSDAFREFERSVALTPWLALPAESAAYTALRLATSERDPSRRAALLGEAKGLLARARSYAIGGPGSWALTAQIAFAEARAGEPSQFAVSRDAFATALRLRPGDPRLLAQSAWVSLESGDAREARRTAEQALARDPGEWLAWAVLARALRVLGDAAGAGHAAARARDLAPFDARGLLDPLIR